MNPTRRRGEALTRAIFDATLAELADNGFEGLTFERVARRAGAGKASLYQRWDTPTELVTAALVNADAEPGVRPVLADQGDLRAELVCFLDDLAHVLTTPLGRALHPLVAQARRHPELHDRVFEVIVRPRQQLIEQAVRRAEERGEVVPGVVTPRLVGTGPKLLIMADMVAPVTHDDVVEVVDQVLMPAFTRRP